MSNEAFKSIDERSYHLAMRFADNQSFEGRLMAAMALRQSAPLVTRRVPAQFDPPFARPALRDVSRNDVSFGNQFASQPSTSLSPLGGGLKRAGDMVIACGALAVFAPLMLITALLVKLTSPGPVIYAHPRIGHGGRVFRCLKFRSMATNGDEVLAHYFKANPSAKQQWERDQKLDYDPRVTWLGRVIRKSSIDELPQLLNVLLGDMSCVGPRPVVAAELKRYGPHVGSYLSTRPGLTGIWQVSGRSNRSYGERVSLDRFYVRRWTARLDIIILLKTVPCLIRFKDAA